MKLGNLKAAIRATKGNPIIVSGNHGRRVAEAVYSKSRVYAYVVPN